MDGNAMITLLIVVTLGAGLILGVMQWMRVRRSQTRRGEHSGDVTVTGAELDARTETGADVPKTVTGKPVRR